MGAPPLSEAPDDPQAAVTGSTGQAPVPPVTTAARTERWCLPVGRLEGQPATRIHDHLGDQAQPEVALGTAERGIESNSLVLGGPMPSLPWPPLATLLSEPDET